VEHGTPEWIEARRLLSFIEWFLPVEADAVPDNSILREFVGGSNLQNFKVWGAWTQPKESGRLAPNMLPNPEAPPAPGRPDSR
jgi:hypothetical protein